MAQKPKKKQPKKKFTPDELKQRAEKRRLAKVKNDHIRTVRSVFRNAGFDRAPEVANQEIKWGAQAGEFDDAFVSENVILLVEYTTSQSSDVPSHLKNKKILFSKILAEPKDFLKYLREKFIDFDGRLGKAFHTDKYIIRIIYCSLNNYDQNIKQIVAEPVYLDFPELKYFEKLASILKLSCRAELLSFLMIEPLEVANKGVFLKKTESHVLEGSILPESSSGFPPGFKIVSFYVDAASLLSRAYVLRRDGWRGSFQAYQRMVSGPKIEAIRKKLKTDHQVFVNNLIATLPSDVHPEKADGTTVDIATLVETSPVKIRLPSRPNSIGMIDGQHRLYSYYETRDDDPEIAKLRRDQNLLVTGIIYPEDVNQSDQERFEAKLFLSINSNQTNAPTALRQAIEVVLEPYSPTAIGRQVIQRLASSGPLSGHVENYFFDKGKLKTSSIVSFGLGPLLKLGGTDSLFSIFSHPEKADISSGKAQEALDDYLQFSASKINIFLNAVKANIAPNRWTTDRHEKDRMIVVTYINSFLITIRHIVQAGGEIEFDYLKSSLKGIDNFDFKAYHSSQYARLAEKLFQTHFPALAAANTAATA
ncbi:MAG: DGQHR domain-containing protein [Proteobacteria bacterium]|nr:DGQHR domain-containing protein [Pseudomonadota bacterium]